MTLYTRGFSHFVTSMTAPIASGWSDSCRVGLAPTEKRRLSTAHTQPGHSAAREASVISPLRQTAVDYSEQPPTAIRDAQFVALEGENHLLLEDEPAWPRFLSEVRGFLNNDG